MFAFDVISEATLTEFFQKAADGQIRSRLALTAARGRRSLAPPCLAVQSLGVLDFHPQPLIRSAGLFCLSRQGGGAYNTPILIEINERAWG